MRDNDIARSGVVCYTKKEWLQPLLIMLRNVKVRNQSRNVFWIKRGKEISNKLRRCFDVKFFFIKKCSKIQFNEL